MKSICAWCKKELEDVPDTEGDDRTSHGICPECKVADYKPLTPLTFEQEEWTEMVGNLFNNKRNSNVFKEGVDGKPYYVNAFAMVKKNDDCESSWGGLIELKGNKLLKRCYIKDVNNIPTVRIIIPTIQHSKDTSDWDFLPIDESCLDELKKYYDLEIVNK